MLSSLVTDLEIFHLNIYTMSNLKQNRDNLSELGIGFSIAYSLSGLPVL